MAFESKVTPRANRGCRNEFVHRPAGKRGVPVRKCHISCQIPTRTAKFGLVVSPCSKAARGDIPGVFPHIKKGGRGSPWQGGLRLPIRQGGTPKVRRKYAES